MRLIFRETAKQVVKDLKKLSTTFRLEIGHFIKERPIYFYQVWLDDCVLFVSDDKTECVIMHKKHNTGFIRFKSEELLELPKENDDEYTKHEL
jgi:hypothetical protein